MTDMCECEHLKDAHNIHDRHGNMFCNRCACENYRQKKDPAVKKAEEFAKIIRRASRAHDQKGEGRAIQSAIYYLRSLKGSPVEEAANEAYNAVLRRKYAWDDPIA